MEENNFDSKPVKLIEEDITYDNLVEQPILKAIAEASNRVNDLDEMIYKKGKDIEKDKAWVSEVIADIPEYSTSNFVGRIVKLNNDMGDVIKLLMLENLSLKKCVKEMYEIVKAKYGIPIEENEVPIQTTKITTPSKSDIDYIGYLNSIIEMKGPEGDIANSIKTEFENDNSGQENKKKFDSICENKYKNESEKSTKRIIAKIWAFQINSNEEVKK